MEEMVNRCYVFEPVDLDVKDFASEGLILDIGGGGEGVIGRLKGKEVVAIDLLREELEEAAEGPLKMVMDARDLKFLDSSFTTATAFFSMMYLDEREDQRKVLAEAWRVLKAGGRLHLWDIDLAGRPETEKEMYLVHLRYHIGGEMKETGYGRRWPQEPRGAEDYIRLAEEAGFQHIATERTKHVFYLVFAKP
jgi:ubiquinone/menaquinone biosynthesis C-methylase UbiE